MNKEELNLQVCAAALSMEVRSKSGDHKYYMVADKDGNARWLFSSSLKEPLFLHTYNAISLRSRILRFVLVIAFYTRLLHRFSAHVLYASHCINDSAFFLGTVGPNRKIVKVRRQGVRVFFEKIPFGINSEVLIDRESKILKDLNRSSTIRVPKVLNGQGLITEKIADQLSGDNPSLDTVWDSYRKVSNYKDSLGIHPHVREAFVRSTYLITEELCKGDLALVKFGFGHGDFTPWNMKLGKSNDLTILDWELSGTYPVLYDWFHYHIQKAIMDGRRSKDVYAIAERVMSFDYVRDFSKKNRLNVYTQFKAYLRYVYTFYSYVYQQQDELHHQAKHALNVWRDLISIVSATEKRKMRDQLIKDIFNQLKTEKYAWVKSKGVGLESISIESDIDLAFPKEARAKFTNFLKLHLFVKKAIVRQYSVLTQVELYLVNGEFLSIDLIHEFKRNACTYLDINEVLNKAIKTVDGLRLAHPLNDSQYIFHFYFLNNADIPSHYADWIGCLNKYELAELRTHVKLVYGPSAKEHFFKITDAKKENGRRYFRKVYGQGLPTRLMNDIRYSLDLVKRKLFNVQPIISFTGVDGAGKTTVLTTVKQTLEQRFRKEVRVLRHRPSLLPIISSIRYGKKEAERRTTLTLPRQGKNQSRLGSLLRYVYYLVDYVIGQVVIKFKYSHRGEIVLYDRYIYDFIVDPRRSNLNLPVWVRRLGAYLVSDPDLNIFLYAEPEVILKRKAELSKEDIEMLTDGYTNLFKYKSEGSSKKFISIKNHSLKETIRTILDQYTLIA